MVQSWNGNTMSGTDACKNNLNGNTLEQPHRTHGTWKGSWYTTQNGTDADIQHRTESRLYLDVVSST